MPPVLLAERSRIIFGRILQCTIRRCLLKVTDAEPPCPWFGGNIRIVHFGAKQRLSQVDVIRLHGTICSQLKRVVWFADEMAGARARFSRPVGHEKVTSQKAAERVSCTARRSDLTLVWT